MTLLNRPMTLEAFLRLPERKPALEFEEGVITRKMSPKGKHSGLQVWFVGRFDRDRPLGRIAKAFSELRITFAGRSYVPDVSVYRWDRVQRDENGRFADDFTTPPNLVVEIVSPKQSVTKLVSRCAWYVENGVPAAVLVDDKDELVLVVRPGQALRTLRGAESIDLSDVIAGLSLSADQVFDALGERAP